MALGRLRSYLLLTLVFGVLAGWAAAIDSGRLFDTWAFLKDTETDTGNVITAGTLRPPINLCTSGNTCTSTSSSVHLAWSLGTGVTPTGQKVFRATGACPGSGLPGGAAQVGSNQTAAATSFDDATVAAATTYCYYVQSFLQNWTANSNTAQITTASTVNLTVDQSDAPDPDHNYEDGDVALTYTVTVTNNGAAADDRRLLLRRRSSPSLIQHLPAGLTFSSVTTNTSTHLLDLRPGRPRRCHAASTVTG